MKLPSQTKLRVADAVLAACVILLLIAFVFSIIKCDWLQAVCHAVWIYIAFRNVKTNTNLTDAITVIEAQDRFIDRICKAIENAKKDEPKADED